MTARAPVGSTSPGGWTWPAARGPRPGEAGASRPTDPGIREFAILLSPAAQRESGNPGRARAGAHAPPLRPHYRPLRAALPLELLPHQVHLLRFLPATARSDVTS